MKVRAFHAADGDCILLSSNGNPPRHILVDGGRKGSYEQNARAFLGQLAADGGKLDAVCVSHIDDDHISGILRLVEDEVEWRVFEFLNNGPNPPAAPRFPRPPEIKEVWHNGLFRLVGDEVGSEPEIVLANVATLLAGSPDDNVRRIASRLDDLATGERSSMELSRRLAPEQLRIPLNPQTGGGLLKRHLTGPPGPGEHVALGSLNILLLGPSDADIVNLREEWKKWIAKSRTALDKLHREMLEDEGRLGTLSPRIVANPMLDQALGEGLSGVTEANLASIMLLVEEGTTTALLTGDGVSSEILKGLERHDKLDASGKIHVNLLKVQHHGAKANVTSDFVEHVTADHYLFCGNGSDDNPEVEVVEAFANARLAGTSTSFHFWFTSSPDTPDDSEGKLRQKHMTLVKEAVERLRQGNEARLNATFIDDGHLQIDV